MNILEQKVAQKPHKNYSCKFCHYNTSKNNDFNKHLLTRKHQKNSGLEHFEQKKSQKSPNHICSVCGKQYMSRNGLWYHEKQCVKNEDKIKDLNNDDLVVMMGEALKQMKKQSDIISELVPKVGNNNNNTNFNLNIFLNEDCKDAVDWGEFLMSIDLKVDDLHALKNSNITTSISNAICNKINELGVYKRPIHCYDPKRKKLCIKNNKDWEKDDDMVNSLIEKGDKQLQHKYITLIRKWEEENPNFMNDDKLMEEYVELQSKLYDNVDNKKSKISLIKEINIPK